MTPRNKENMKKKEHVHVYGKLMGIDEYCVGCSKYRIEIEESAESTTGERK